MVSALAARVKETILRYNMLPRGNSRVGVAVSGGADSIFLLTVLKQLAPHLTILHLNHGLRGSESDADEAFVVETAARVRLPLAVERISGLAGPNLEERAREARYEFFARAAAAHQLDRVATGHTLDDQAETFLLRLVRGAGGTGLAGIQPVTAAGIIRPLLDIERREIEDWLTGRRIPWREDASNQDPVFARNRIRHGLLPLLEREWNPSIRRLLSRTAGILGTEEAYWREWAATQLATVAHVDAYGLILDLEPLRSLHPAPLRRLLRAAVERARGDLRRIDQEHIDRLVRVCQSGQGTGAARLPGLTAVRSFGQLLLAIGELVQPPVDGTPRIRYNTGAGVLPGSIGPPVVVRAWRPGDAYQPAGHSRRRKIKDLFQEHKVPSWERRSWPIIVSEGQILWARRFGLAAGAGLNWTCEDEMRAG